jgi:hypothetical protein
MKSGIRNLPPSTASCARVRLGKHRSPPQCEGQPGCKSLGRCGRGSGFFWRRSPSFRSCSRADSMRLSDGRVASTTCASVPGFSGPGLSSDSWRSSCMSPSSNSTPYNGRPAGCTRHELTVPAKRFTWSLNATVTRAPTSYSGGAHRRLSRNAWRMTGYQVAQQEDGDRRLVNGRRKASEKQRSSRRRGERTLMREGWARHRARGRREIASHKHTNNRSTETVAHFAFFAWQSAQRPKHR